MRGWEVGSLWAKSSRNIHDENSLTHPYCSKTDSATSKGKWLDASCCFMVQSRVICTSASVCLGGGKQKAEMTLQLQWHQFWTWNTWLVASVCYFHGGTSAPQDHTHPLNYVWCSSKLNLEIDCPHVGDAYSSGLSDGIGWHQGPCSSSYKELSSKQFDLEPISATW